MHPTALMEKRPTAEQSTEDQDTWFRSPEAQARHQEALKDVAEGRVEHLESSEDLLRKLKSA